jgi:hypothetical protein
MSPSPFPLLWSGFSGSSAPPGFLHPKRLRWPKDWYAVDIVAGFNQLDNLSKLDSQRRVLSDVAGRLSSVFGCNIPLSTYYDTRKQWNNASHSLRDKVLDAGKTPFGLWTYLPLWPCTLEGLILVSKPGTLVCYGPIVSLFVLLFR